MAERHTRVLEIDRTRADDESRTAPCVVSTEFPVERDGYREILSHAEGAVDFSRTPLPVLEAHDNGAVPVGIIEGLRLVGRKLRGTLRMGNTARAAELWQDVRAGILRNLSVGYSWLEHRDQGDDILVSRWRPHEVSLVAAPADPGAGLYRHFGDTPMSETETLDRENESENLTPVTNAVKREMSRSQRRRESRTATDERERVSTIYSLFDMAAHLRSMTDTRDAFIREGTDLETVRTWVRRQRPDPVPSAPRWDDGNSRPFGDYSLVRALRAISDPRAARDAEHELDVSRTLERQLGRRTKGLLVPMDALGIQQRAITKSGTSSATIATDVLAAEFIDVLRARTLVMSLGARVLGGLKGDVAIPRKTAGASAYWIAGDNADSLTESTPTLDQLGMSPKTVGGLVTFSHKMLVQSSPDIEQLVREDLADMLAVEIDNKALQGDGTGNTPTGILNTSSIGSTTYVNGGAPDFADVVGLEGTVAAANADAGTLAYLTTPALMTGLKTTDVGTDTGQFVWSPGRERGQGAMNGMPAYYTYNMPAGYILFGNFADLVIGFWSVLELDADPYGSNFAKGSVTVRAIMDVDIGVRHAASFAEIHEAAP